MAVVFDATHLRPCPCMPSRLTIIAIAAVIAIPLIFAALGATQAAGLAFGVVLVVVGLGWSAISGRAAADPDDADGDEPPAAR
jgi:hypothetical protein